MFPSSISSSNNPFLLIGRVFIFLSPLILVLFYFEIILWRGGEIYPLQKVIDKQVKNNRLIFSRRYFSHDESTYKYLMIQRRKPEILILGSSRVLNFRSEMFEPLGQDFYNGGRLINGVSDLIKLTDVFLSREIIPPKVMIIGIDPWWLRRDYTEPNHFDPLDLRDDAFLPAAHVMAIRGMIKNRKFYFSFLNPFMDIGKIQNNWKAVGLGAHAGKGYRLDGYRVDLKLREEFIRNPRYVDRENPPVIERVRRLQGKFFPTPGVSWNKFAVLLDTLKKIRALGVEIYIFLPPFSNEVTAEIMTTRSLRNWINEYFYEMPVSFLNAGFYCFGVISPDRLGLDDIYMVDGFHPGEVFISYMMEALLNIIPDGSYLSGISRSNLNRMRNNSETIPISFPL